MLEELFPTMRAISGFCGAEMLRRIDGNEVVLLHFSDLTRTNQFVLLLVIPIGDPSLSRVVRSCLVETTTMQLL